MRCLGSRGRGACGASGAEGAGRAARPACVGTSAPKVHDVDVDYSASLEVTSACKQASADGWPSLAKGSRSELPHMRVINIKLP
eukprot:3090857-Prymnesium_polylepis.1